MNTITNKDFTFQTDMEYYKETIKCSLFDFNGVRIETTYKDGRIIDEPLKTFDDYHNFIEKHKKSPDVESYHVYPVKHGYERKFWGYM